jgi:hypothetical protein
MFFREYDPALGRMNAVDPMVSKYASLTPYNYAFNDPVYFNDPLGDDPSNPARGSNWWRYDKDGSWRDVGAQDASTGGMYGSSWNYETYGGGFSPYGVGTGSLAAAEQEARIKAFLRNLFKDYDVSFASNGSGFWVRYTGLDESSVDIERGILASPIIGYLRVSGITRDQFRTEMNPLVRSMRAQTDALFADPRVQILYGFLLGGGVGGTASGFASRGAAVAARQFGTRLFSNPAAKNMIKNTLFEFSSQMLANKGNVKTSITNMDWFDIATGARFSKNKGFAMIGGVADLSLSGGFTFTFGPDGYNKSLASSLSDGLINAGIGNVSNSRPLLQESILEILGGTFAQKISEGW